MNKIKQALINFWYWIKSWFIRYYEISVSFNKEWGDSDDKTFIAKKIITQKEKHLKFRTRDGRTVEYRSAGGLNYVIKDLD